MCADILYSLTVITTTDLLDLTEKSSSEWSLSDDESETEEVTNPQQGNFSFKTFTSTLN